MGRIILVLVMAVILLLVAAVVLPFLIPVETYRSQIETVASEATGRELSIKGDMSLSFFPPATISVEDVSFANADGAEDPLMAEIGSLSIGVDVLPFLLENRIAVSRFVLEDPRINLEVDARGEPNWVFETMAEGAPSDPGPDPAPTGSGDIQLQEISLGDVRLVNGTVNYVNRQTGDRYEARDINVTVTLPSLDGPLGVDGSVVYNGERVNLDTTVANPRAFLEQQSTDVSADIASKHINLDFTGSAAMTGADGATLPLDSTGTADLNVPSIRALSAWLGSPLPEGEGLGPLAVSGTVRTQTDRIAFGDADLRLDDMRGQGDLVLELAGARPAVKGTMTLDQIDTRPYEPAPVENGPGSGGGGSSAPAQSQEWSREPIDFSSLKTVDADIQVMVGRVITSTLKMGESGLNLSLENGRLQADLKELALYEGRGELFLEIDARSATPTIRNRTSFNVIQAQPLLRDLIESGVLAGIGNLEVDVTTRGGSAYDLVNALNGQGKLAFNDGSLFGVNLAQLIRSPAEAIAALTLDLTRDNIESSNQKTDFAELSASFLIENGVLKTDDMRLLNPLIRLLGQGETNILSRTVDFYLDPRAVGSLEGQGGQADVNGIGVPVRISGTWDKLRFSPDVRGIGADLLDREVGEGAGQLLRDPQGAVRDGLRDLLGGQSEDEAEGGERAPSAGDALRNLFGGGDKDDEKKDKDKKDKESDGAP